MGYLESLSCRFINLIVATKFGEIDRSLVLCGLVERVATSLFAF